MIKKFLVLILMLIATLIFDLTVMKVSAAFIFIIACNILNYIKRQEEHYKMNKIYEPLKAISGIVYKIKRSELSDLQNKFDLKEEFECEEKQLFICHDDINDRYIAVDNSTGDLFIEDFKNVSDAMIWLLDLKESEPLKAAEEEKYWY